MSEFLQLMENWDGFVSVSGNQLNESAMTGLVSLIANTGRLPRHRQQYLLQEAITTSDFPILFGGVLDRQMLAKYSAAPSPWRAYVPTGGLPDFRVATYDKVQGNQDELDLVPEKSEYPIAPVAHGFYNRQVFKRGRKFDLSWESLINDAYGAFTDWADRFANAARYTEALVATRIHTQAGGPNPALFGDPIADPADGQVITNQGVLPLNIQNLEITMALMAQQTDIEGRALGIRGVHLVVPPALEFEARAILTSSFKQWLDDNTGVVSMPTTNVLAMSEVGLQLHVDPNLPTVDVSGNVDTTWYLFADQSRGKWGQLDFLRGHETPEIVMKASNKVSVGGQALDPFGGDFDTDNILWRIRHVLGGSPLDPRFAYAQVGP